MLENVYQKAKFTSYFRHQHPDLFAEMQIEINSIRSRHQNKRYRFQKTSEKTKFRDGEFKVGLKDMLKLEAVGYPEFREKVGIGGSHRGNITIAQGPSKQSYDVLSI